MGKPFGSAYQSFFRSLGTLLEDVRIPRGRKVRLPKWSVCLLLSAERRQRFLSLPFPAAVKPAAAAWMMYILRGSRHHSLLGHGAMGSAGTDMTIKGHERVTFPHFGTAIMQSERHRHSIFGGKYQIGRCMPKGR